MSLEDRVNKIVETINSKCQGQSKAIIALAFTHALIHIFNEDDDYALEKNLLMRQRNKLENMIKIAEYNSELN
jgi:hypothetical protein